jgi:molecular chaperone DnaK (HSP70)
LDDVTGYNSKQRGDKAKEWAKKASKAKSAVSQAKHFMKISSNVSEETRLKAESFIEEIENALANNENTKAAGRGEKLGKLFQ